MKINVTVPTKVEHKLASQESGGKYIVNVMKPPTILCPTLKTYYFINYLSYFTKCSLSTHKTKFGLFDTIVFYNLHSSFNKNISLFTKQIRPN